MHGNSSRGRDNQVCRDLRWDGRADLARLSIPSFDPTLALYARVDRPSMIIPKADRRTIYENLFKGALPLTPRPPIPPRS